MCRYSKTMLNLVGSILRPVPSFVGGLVLDVVFGKFDDTDYVSTTTPAARPYR